MPHVEGAASPDLACDFVKARPNVEDPGRDAAYLVVSINLDRRSTR
jgi:hypothetical protein